MSDKNAPDRIVSPVRKSALPKSILVIVAAMLGAFLLAWGLTLIGVNNIYVAGLAAEIGIPVLILGFILLVFRKTRPAAIVTLAISVLLGGFIVFLPLSEDVENRNLLQLQKDYCEGIVSALIEYRQQYGELPRDLESDYFDRLETPFFFTVGDVQYLSDGYEFSFLVQRAQSKVQPEVYLSGQQAWAVADQHPQALLERGTIYSVRSRVRCYSVDANGQAVSGWCP